MVCSTVMPLFMCAKSKVISDDEIMAIADEYGIRINSDDATQYKLCQVIYNLQEELKSLSGLDHPAPEARESSL